tara:strand:+ start:6996 stop:7283 length:288 start_codon:yes stop_codon:yes gene_type:complete
MEKHELMSKAGIPLVWENLYTINEQGTILFEIVSDSEHPSGILEVFPNNYKQAIKEAKRRITGDYATDQNIFYAISGQFFIDNEKLQRLFFETIN